MSNYQERFEEEILRVGVSKIANTLGIARNTVYNWIANANVPLNMLMTLQGIMGIDAPYVLTGKRSAELQTVADTPDLVILNSEEKALVDHYRNITDKEDKNAILKMAIRSAGAATQKKDESMVKKPAKKAAAAKFIIHGDVGQQFDAPIQDGTFKVDMRKERKKKE